METKLYEFYVNQWIQKKDWKKRLLDSESCLQVLLELAWQMWNSQQNALSVRCDLLQLIKRLRIDEHVIIHEMQTAPFLKYESGMLTFVHHSFIESVS